MTAVALFAIAALVLLGAVAYAGWKAAARAFDEVRAAADQMARAADASREHARAALVLADQVERMIGDAESERRMAWEPILVCLEEASTSPPSPAPGGSASVQNAGRGVAYSCLVAARVHDGYRRSSPRLLVAGATGTFQLSYQIGEAPPEGMFPDGERVALLCQDQFGNVYRFGQYGARRDVWLAAGAGSERARPQWLDAWRRTAGVDLMGTDATPRALVPRG